MNTMIYEEAYNLYRQMWEKRLAKGNRPDPANPTQPITCREEPQRP